MLDLAPNSAHAATITAKIIPNTIIILSFLYINLLSLSTSSLPHLISIREASLEASYGCLSKLAYLPRLIFLFTFTTSAKRAATTANVIPNTIIMLPFLYFNYSLFNLFECKDNAFLCAHTIFGERKCRKGYDFLISVKNCHANWSKMAVFSKINPSLNCGFKENYTSP